MTDPADTCEGLALASGQMPVVHLPPDIPALRVFYLYLTAGCNLACRHCWITPTFVAGVPSAGECLDLDLLKKAVTQAQPLGLTAVKLTGGEPVLHPKFPEIAEFLSAAGLELSMETNATLLTRELAEFLKTRTRLSQVAVSLDGPDAAAHDAFRGRPGAFDAAIAGIQHLVAAGFRPQIIMSVYRGNRDQITALVELARRLGAGSVKFNPVTPTGRGVELHRQGQGLSFDEALELLHWIRGPLQDRYDTIHLSIMAPPAMATVRELLRYGAEGAGCRVRHILGILGTGEMALCGIGRQVPELVFGHLATDDLQQVWSRHPVLRQMRKDLEGPYPGICGDCLHAGRCLTHCLAQNYEYNGTLVSPSPLCAEAERRGRFPATRRISWESRPRSA